jgi:hypothetical protein
MGDTGRKQNRREESTKRVLGDYLDIQSKESFVRILLMV